MDLDANRKLVPTALPPIAAGHRNVLATGDRLPSAKLFAVCLRILSERSAAEDALQEVYMTVWRKSAQFDAGLASPMTWLIAIARNRAIDFARARGSSRNMEPIEVAAELADDAPMADTTMQTAQDQARLYKCLGGPAEPGRTALRGAFFDGNTYEELAERMKVPLGTMKSWIRRAMLKLKSCLEQ